MIIGSSGFLGSYIYKTLKNRRDILKEMLTAIDILQAEIVFKRAELPGAISEAAARVKGLSRAFWQSVSDIINKGEGIDKAFAAALNDMRMKGLTKEDVDIISSLTGILGKYDSLEQAQMMKNVKELINIQWRESDREFKEKGKLYRALGLSFGIVIALVMI